MAVRKKSVTKKASGKSPKKPPAKTATKKSSAAKGKVSKKKPAKQTPKKPAASSRKALTTAKRGSKTVPQKAAAGKKAATPVGKGKPAKKIATRTSTKNVSTSKVSATTAANKKAAAAAVSKKGIEKGSKSTTATPVKRKIAISIPDIKRPSRISSVAPINPVDLFPSRAKRRRKTADDQLIHGIPPYHPKKDEPYMSDAQLEHFRKILSAWKAELMQEVDRTVHHMQDEASNFPDPNDRATQESEFGLELRTRDRERKLLKKIDQALARVDDGTYGFCEETGDEIGLKRLEARPVATLSVEAQERREVAERLYRDPDDR